MLSFKQFYKQENAVLCEGGNVVVKDVRGKDIPAEKIDLSKFNRSKFTKDMLEAFSNLNDMFEKEYGFPIWKNMKILKNGYAFNGSSETFFSREITDDEYVAIKPKVGDIDLTVPQEHKKQLWSLLNKLIGKKLSSKVIFVGHNRPNYSPNNHQINSILEYKDGNTTVHAQVDFELTPYTGHGDPAEFTKFAHSSSWADMKEGLKGVHHKYLLRALAGGSSMRDDIVVVTDKATPEKPKLKKLDGFPRMLKFSVDRGLRTAYEPQFLSSGKPWMISGKQVYKEQPTSKSKFETSVEGIFKMMFAEPQGLKDLHNMWSFVGILELMKKYHTKQQVEQTIQRLVDLYWGRGAQGFERNNPELDKAIKMAGYKMVLKYFPYLKKNNKTIERMMNQYYKNYRRTEIGS